MKNERNVLHSFAKDRNILAFFYVLCKRTLHSLRSFMFFAKERNVLLGLISRQKFEKRTEKNGTYQTEKKAVPNPADLCIGTKHGWFQNVYFKVDQYLNRNKVWFVSKWIF